MRGLRNSLAAAGIAAALAALPAAAETIVIENVTLIDGSGTKPQPAMTVVVEDGHFTRVVPTAAAGDLNGQRLDGTGKFLIPGLMDMHIHLKGGTRVTKEGFREVAINRKTGEAALASYLYAGVTSIYDAGNNPDYIYALRADERAGKIQSPRIFATGGVVTYPGSHGTGPGYAPIDSWPEAKPILDKHIELKPDIVKFTLEERGWGARPTIPLLPVDLLQRAIEYYNDRGIRTTVHTSGETRAREAIFAGIDTLAHPVIQGPITAAFAKLMGARKIPMTTTLAIGENYSRLAEHPEYLDQPLYRAALSAAEIQRLKTEQREQWQNDRWTWWMKLMTPVAQDNLRQIHEAGGVLVLGTDQTIGPAVHREMELLADAGIPPLEIITMATRNGAIFLGRAHDMGTIAPGKLADAVLLDADPTADINNAKAIRWVMKGGRIIDESKLPLAGTAEKRR